EVLGQRVDADAHPLLKVRHFRLRLVDALGRIQQGEHRTGHRHHDEGGDEHLDDREPANSTATATHYCAFRVLTVIIRASSGRRRTAPWSAEPRFRLRVTSTWRTSVLFGF